MDAELTEYSNLFHNDVNLDADEEGLFKEEAFVLRVSHVLIEYGELGDFEPSPYRAPGVKVDGFDWDEDYKSLTLVVAVWFGSSDLREARLGRPQVTQARRRALTFLQRALKGRLQDQIDISCAAHDLCQSIEENRKALEAVKVVVVSDGVCDERAAEMESVDGVECRTVVWDISRLHRFERTGQREELEVCFERDYGGALPCLAQKSRGGEYTTYLAFVPGTVLADLYGKWKTRLLERNVRVFLSQKQKVNQGIRDTIRNEPGMFCAYNNGITVQAKAVELVSRNGAGQAIRMVRDFQIVNGGQTTASLFHTREKFNAELEDTWVQMKLMVIDDGVRPVDLDEGVRLSDVLVPRIGRFSNTQNNVQAADLSANDPPHPELGAISTNTPAPDPTGGSLQSFWFYERSRGGYEELCRLEARTPAQERKFRQKYPKSQTFDKLLLGRVWNTYRGLPHTVSLGRMKNFAHFSRWLTEQNEDWQTFFKKTVALVMLWNSTYSVIRGRKYGAFMIQNCSYTLSWFHALTEQRVDLLRLWEQQRVDEVFLEAAGRLSEVVNTHIRDTRLNVGEWCKKEECWTGLKERNTPKLPDLTSLFLPAGGREQVKPGPDSSADDIAFCESRGATAWFSLSKWLKERGFMQGKQRSQCFQMGRAVAQAGKRPSSSLSYACRKIWKDAEGLGWRPEADLKDAVALSGNAHSSPVLAKGSKPAVSEQKTASSPSETDYTSKKPTSVKVLDKHYAVKSWKDVLLAVGQRAADHHGPDFARVLDLWGKSSPYFAEDKRLLRKPVKVTGTTIYVETNLNANLLMSICYQVLEVLGHSRDALSLKVR